MALCVTELFPTKSVETEYLFPFLVPQPSVPKMIHGNFEGCMPGIQCHHRSSNWGANPELQKSQGFLAAHHFPCKDLILVPSISFSSMDFYSNAKLHFRNINGYNCCWRLFDITEAVSPWKAWRCLNRIRSRYYSMILETLTLDVLLCLQKEERRAEEHIFKRKSIFCILLSQWRSSLLCG